MNIVDELTGLLERQGVEIRTVSLGGGGGGLCRIKGKYTFFIDSDAATAETAGLCAEAVVRLIDIESVYLKPEVREFVEKYSASDKG